MRHELTVQFYHLLEEQQEIIIPAVLIEIRFNLIAMFIITITFQMEDVQVKDFIMMMTTITILTIQRHHHLCIIGKELELTITTVHRLLRRKIEMHPLPFPVELALGVLFKIMIVTDPVQWLMALLLRTAPAIIIRILIILPPQ